LINAADKFCRNIVVPPCKDPLYRDEIIKIVKDESITHIIPTNDHAVRALYNMHSDLSQLNVLLNGYCHNMIKCLDKEATAKLFENNCISTPKVISKPVVPFVLRKKDMGSSKKFVHIVKSNDEMNTIPDEDYANGIITQYVSGEEFTVDVLCDSNSEVLVAIPRLRVVVQNGMVWHGKTVHDENLIYQIKNIVKRLSLTGIICIQCIKSLNAYYFIEINPRPGSGIDLSINSNANIPLAWVNLTLGKKTEFAPIWDMNLIRYYSGHYFVSK
jgi:carbamoyl-phosphate synthase large subunit